MTIQFALRAAIASCLLLAALLCGCAGLNNGLATNSEAKPMWSYGNFCGGGYPQNSKGLRPVDDVDLLCFYHDRCYDAAGKASSFCDMALSQNISYLLDTFKRHKYEGVPQRCGNALVEISVFANSNVANDDEFSTKAINAFTRIQQAPALLLLSALLDHGTPVRASLCNAKADSLKLKIGRAHV